MKSDEIISIIVNRLLLKQDDIEKNAFYNEYYIDEEQILMIRVSNHKSVNYRYKQKLDKVFEQMGKIIRKCTLYSFVFEDEKFSNCDYLDNLSEKVIIYENTYVPNIFNSKNIINFCNSLKILAMTGYYDYDTLGRYLILPKEIKHGGLAFGSIDTYHRFRDWIYTLRREEAIETFNYFFDKILIKDERIHLSKLYDINDKNNFEIVKDKKCSNKFDKNYIEHNLLKIPDWYKQFNIDYTNNTWQLCGLYRHILSCAFGIMQYLYTHPEDNYKDLQNIIGYNNMKKIISAI